MLKQFRRRFIEHLWTTYRSTSPDMQKISDIFFQQSKQSFFLDHFAVIDLPGPHSGLSRLINIFSALGYVAKGRDYLADKQNNFAWLSEIHCEFLPAQDALPQAVVADFCLEALPDEIKKIIEKYALQIQPFPLEYLKQLVNKIENGGKAAFIDCFKLLRDYFSGRDWELPSIKDFSTVNEFNELLAWVLVFGRKPNHFTLSIHLMEDFSELADFHRLIEKQSGLHLNQEGGLIKGGKTSGIAQSSTKGSVQQIKLADGDIFIPGGFVEFIWRYAKKEKIKPVLWDDYFTGFIARHADSVIESLYSD